MEFDEWVEDILTDGDGLPHDTEHRALVTVQYLGRLFAECGTLLHGMPDAVVGAGLHSAIDGGGAACACDLRDPTVPLELRRQTTLSIYHVFADCFAHRPELQAQPDDRVARYEGWRHTCFMWWDLGCAWDTSLKPHRLGTELLEVMRRVLLIDCRACRFSALHGLGHFVQGDPTGAAQRLIDEFLAIEADRDAGLADYARQARRGQVL